MSALLRLSRSIDQMNWYVSRVAVWLVLISALVSAFNAFFRYGIETFIGLIKDYKFFAPLQTLLTWYGNNSNGFLETQWYMFAGVVLLGAPYTLKVNEHVRVDVLYGSVSERTRVWIDLIGTLICLVPMCVILTYFTWPWFVDAWLTNEQSSNAGGLPRWPVKLLMPVGFLLMLFQGLSELIKCTAALTVAGYAREHHYEKPLQ
jgi:TRAP-type mannitol/chloroaromatic compound transport system permease small subunit